MKFIYLSAILWAGITGTAAAQELRNPDETKEIVINSTYPVRLNAVIADDDKLYVWVDYRNIYTTNSEEGYHRSGFSAKKLLIYENNKLVREILELKDIPDPLAVGYNVWPLKGIDSLPHGEETANTITVFGHSDKDALTKLGFAKNKFILGPFDYRVVNAWPIGKDEKGFLYVRASGCNTKERRDKRGAWEPFGALYVLNKELRLVDSFIYHKAKEADPLEILSASEGHIFLSKAGYFYSLDWQDYSRYSKIIVRKWVSKIH